MSNVSSILAREIVASLEQNLAHTAEALAAADHRRKLAVRSALLSHEHGAADAAAVALTAARTAHETASLALTEGRQLLSDAIAAERASAEDKLREELRTVAAKIEASAAEADLFFASYVGKVRETAALEAEAREIVQAKMSRPVALWVRTSDALTDAAAYLRTVRAGTADAISPFVATRAGQGVKAALDVAGA